MDLTAVIRKGEKQYVALCPELDIVSQGHTVEEALTNIREAAELYLEEMGLPEGVSSSATIIARFEVDEHGKTSSAVRA